ncbi:MAG: hypothetical protein LBU32_08630 [Clostridiales bacterium]|jgi:predicted nucleic acid-binding protein|nr:hypothetical protein [Clostridiales bacterium]
MTKVMIDANVLIFAILGSGGMPNAATRKAANPPYTLVLSDYIIDELRRIFNRKFPHRILDMERFITVAHYDLAALAAADAVLEGDAGNSSRRS